MAFKTSPLSSHIGVEIKDLPLSNGLDDKTADDLRDLLQQHHMLLFRDQNLDAESHIAVMRAFGNVIAESPDRSLHSKVTNIDPNGYAATSGKLIFHCDGQFTEYGPIRIISLYALEMERGEPTVYKNMVRAAEILPANLRKRIETLRVVQMLDLSAGFSETRRHRMSQRLPGVPDAQYPHCTQPMIRKHPETGAEYLNVSQLMTSHVDGCTDAESDALFAELEQYAYDAENSYTHIWRLNDLLVWNNVALQHGREALDVAARRTLRRVAVNPVDMPTIMRDVRPDPVKFARLQWWPEKAAPGARP